jgi:hypothetical protein
MDFMAFSNVTIMLIINRLSGLEKGTILPYMPPYYATKA